MKSWADIVKTPKPESTELLPVPISEEEIKEIEYSYMMKTNPFAWNDVTEQYRKKVNKITVQIKNLETKIGTNVLDKIEEKNIMKQIYKLPLEKNKLLPFCVIAPIDGKTRLECYEENNGRFSSNINNIELFPFHDHGRRGESSMAVTGSGPLLQDKHGTWYDENDKKHFINIKNEWTVLI